MSLSLVSPSFSNKATIPSRYTCEGENVSPALSWEGNPGQTKSYVLIMDDPDAPVATWDHWILFNIPANMKEIKENDSIPSGTSSGKNSWGNTGYGGPCPPTGEHRYVFKLYALDIPKLNLKTEKPNKKEVKDAMEGHIIARSELIGLYKKKN